MNAFLSPHQEYSRSSVANKCDSHPITVSRFGHHRQFIKSRVVEGGRLESPFSKRLIVMDSEIQIIRLGRHTHLGTKNVRANRHTKNNNKEFYFLSSSSASRSAVDGQLKSVCWSGASENQLKLFHRRRRRRCCPPKPGWPYLEPRVHWQHNTQSSISHFTSVNK